MTDTGSCFLIMAYFSARTRKRTCFRAVRKGTTCAVRPAATGYYSLETDGAAAMVTHPPWRLRAKRDDCRGSSGLGCRELELRSRREEMKVRDKARMLTRLG